MRLPKELPVLSIDNFEDYKNCCHFGNNFYIRKFSDHLRSNRFLDDPHGHDFFIILLITEGSGVHNIDFNTYEVKPGTVFFLSPGQVHNWVLSDDIDGYITFFTKEYFLLDFTFNKLSKFPFFHTHIKSPFLQLNERELPEIYGIFSDMDREYQERKRLYNDIIRLKLSMLLISMERSYKSSSSGLNSPYHIIQLNRIESLIDEHYRKHLSVSDYAGMMHMSVKQLNGICKKLLNRTMSDLIHDRVILEAKRLLIHTENPVSRVAEILNFTDHSYFIRLFRKSTALTPEQFRQAKCRNLNVFR